MLDFAALGETLRAYLTVRVWDIVLGPFDLIILILSFAIALVSAFSLWRVGNSEERRDRLIALRRDALSERSAAPRGPRWYTRIGAMVAGSSIIGTTEQQRWLDLLAGAGIKGQDYLASFTATKVLGSITLPLLAWLCLARFHALPGGVTLKWAILVGAIMLGWRLPDIIVSRLAARRRLYLEQGLPDALDLLVVCAEAGLSLDQSIEQVSRDLRVSNPAVADEFATTAAEMRVLSNRSEALDNLARRTKLQNLQGITATLTQAIRFGTPLAESMRILAADMRAARLARLEERAARLPVLLAIPLMAFIMPALFMVIGTPVALRIFDYLHNFKIAIP
jgi:tight adherence protein C